MDLFHMFSSYLITEILIMKCLYLDPQFQSRWVKKTFGITNKWEVQLNIEGIEKKIKNWQVRGGGTFIWYSRVHVLYIFQYFNNIFFNTSVYLQRYRNPLTFWGLSQIFRLCFSISHILLWFLWKVWWFKVLV